MKKIFALALSLVLCSNIMHGLKLEKIPYGDFEKWVTRKIPESKVIGGKEKTIYAIGPTQTITGAKAWNGASGCPWATSNVYASVVGVNKASGTVTPATKGGSQVARLESKMEHVKAVGIVNMDVMVAGTIFLGKMDEPIKSTKSPYSKMEMGMPYTKRPTALVFDYAVEMPSTNTRTKATGLGSTKTLQGRDCAEVYVILQRRWEDSKGNIYAKRVGTGRERFTKSVGWTTGHQLPINYGDITKKSFYQPWMGLLNGDKAMYARNSKGKLVQVHEIDWDLPNATPTHVLVMASSASGEPFVGTEGIVLYIDNICFGF